MILGTLFWLIVAIMALGVVIFVAEVYKDDKSRSGLVVGMAIISIIVAGIALLLVFGVSDDVDVSYGLDENRVYYLNATAQDPTNPQKINLVLFETDTITGKVEKPIIVIVKQKDEIAQGVEPGKYVFENAQGQVEIWTAPIKT